ncbi:MAG TPA: translation initiation factor IF-2 subunit beta [Candidatus Nanoarchaeia archaeon]|nr:translation initiation factor IF-2 subunit beta [Candidatus Nanoarchaeia archaeon]
MDYDKLLDRALTSLPESAMEKLRFEIPQVKGHLEGSKTILSNLPQIADTLGRELNHLAKFILREIGTAGEMKGSQVILKTKVPASKINEKIRKYANEFVLCADCGKPDTKIEKDKDIIFLKCMACGSKRAVKYYFV